MITTGKVHFLEGCGIGQLCSGGSVHTQECMNSTKVNCWFGCCCCVKVKTRHGMLGKQWVGQIGELRGEGQI